MFESLFKHPRALARQQEGPAAEARQRLLSHCSAQGMARATLAAACPGSSRYRWPNRGYVWQSRHPAGDRRGGRLLDPRSDPTAPCSGSKLVAGSVHSNSERLAWLPAGFGEESQRNLIGDFERFVKRQGPLQRLAFDQLHYQIVRPHVVEMTNIRMIQRSHGAGFTLESLIELFARSLDGDFAMQARVTRAIHLAHAAFAEMREYFVGTGTGSRSQWPRVSTDSIQPGANINRVLHEPKHNDSGEDP